MAKVDWRWTRYERVRPPIYGENVFLGHDQYQRKGLTQKLKSLHPINFKRFHGDALYSTVATYIYKLLKTDKNGENLHESCLN